MCVLPQRSGLTQVLATKMNPLGNRIFQLRNITCGNFTSLAGLPPGFRGVGYVQKRLRFGVKRNKTLPPYHAGRAWMI